MTDRCECHGQCSKHESRCVALFGQRHLFDAQVDVARIVKGRALCESCAQTFDLQRAARARRAANIASEGQRFAAWTAPLFDKRPRAE